MSKLAFRPSAPMLPRYPTRQEFLLLKRRGGRRITVAGLGVLLLSSCSVTADPPTLLPDGGSTTTHPTTPLAGGAPYDPDAAYLRPDLGSGDSGGSDGASE